MQRKMGVRKKVCSDLQGGMNTIAAAAGDSSNDDPEFVGAKNEDSILGMGKDNYGRATPMTVFDKN